MAGTKISAAGLELIPQTNAANTFVSNRKVTQTTQDFGKVLDRASEKISQADNKKQDTFETSKDNTTQNNTCETERTKSAGEPEIAENQDVSKQPEKTEEKISQEFESAKKEEEPIDEMTIAQIADALQQIIEQIKEILGVSDEEILSGMENIGMKPFELLNPDNMVQLVTAAAGEDSAISLVANEELYSALQDITNAVESVSEGLLEDAGITKDELDIILEKLQAAENDEMGMPVEAESRAAEIIPFERPEGVDANENSVNVTADDKTEEVQDSTTVVIAEDKSQTKVNEDEVKELPEDNCEDIIKEDTVKLQPQRHESGSRHMDEHNNEAKDFGQQQNFQNNLEQVEQTAEPAQGYTTESTANILRQLADFVKIVKNENLTEMEMQLHPASLGTVNVSLTTKAGAVTAHFTTQNEAVKEAVEAQAVQLRANLEEQGIKVEAVEVSVGSHQMERNLEKDNEQQQKQQEQEEKRVRAMRKGSINFNSFVNDEEIEEEMLGADDATRIAMEMMAANGNSMDLLA